MSSTSPCAGVKRKAETAASNSDAPLLDATALRLRIDALKGRVRELELENGRLRALRVEELAARGPSTRLHHSTALERGQANPEARRLDRMCQFPHAVVSDKAGRPQLQVEGRRITTYCFELRTEDGQATQSHSDFGEADGTVMLVGELCYADSMQPVDAADFTKWTAEHICTPPPYVHNKAKHMIKGRVAWRIEAYHITSKQTTPKDRLFVFRVRPADLQQRNKEALTVTTEPFSIVCKIKPAASRQAAKA